MKCTWLKSGFETSLDSSQIFESLLKRLNTLDSTQVNFNNVFQVIREVSDWLTFESSTTNSSNFNEILGRNLHEKSEDVEDSAQLQGTPIATENPNLLFKSPTEEELQLQDSKLSDRLKGITEENIDDDKPTEEKISTPKMTKKLGTSNCTRYCEYSVIVDSQKL